MRRHLPAAAALVAALSLAAAERGLKFPVGEMLIASKSSAKGDVNINRACDGQPAKIGYNRWHGLGMHAPGYATFDLGRGALRFHAGCSILDKGVGGSVVFNVLGDGRLLHSTGVVRHGDTIREVSVDIRGVKELRLEVTDAGDGNDGDRTYWIDAEFEYEPGCYPPCNVVNHSRQVGVLTPPPAKAPRINGPAVYGARPGHEVIYRVPVTGEAPVGVSVEGLGRAPGLVFDATTRILSGAVAERGDYCLTVVASNAYGVSRRALTVRIGDAIQLTPAMGWNAWNAFAYDVTGADVRAAADALVSTGLADHGWQFVNIDDCWQKYHALEPKESQKRADRVGPSRDADGRIVPAGAFGDMKALTDYIHAKGLKAGIYTSPGPRTCGAGVGSWGHEAADAKTFADWGFDFLKYDWCSYGTTVLGRGRGYQMRPFQKMGELLLAQDRDIVYSIMNGGREDVGSWGRIVHAQQWRTTGDVFDNWRSLMKAPKGMKGLARHSGPGAANDADMLCVGRMYWNEFVGSRLAPNEQYAQMSLWSLWGSPLMIGCDLTKLDDFTLSLLANDEVIDIDQDALCIGAECVVDGEDFEVWLRPLANGDYAAGLFNKGLEEREIAFELAEAGLSGAYLVRDVWRQADEGRFDGRYSASVPGHYVHFVRLRRAEPLETVFWQTEIDRTAASGGGRVTVPPGRHVVGELVLKSNVELHLSDGAELVSACERRLFPAHSALRTPSQKDAGGWRSLLYAAGATNIAVTGRGTIDGRGAFQRDCGAAKGEGELCRPSNMRFDACRGVTVRDVLLKDPATWTHHYYDCEDVLVENVRVFARAYRNNDGVDIDCCRRVVVRGCTIDSEDDGIVLKATGEAACTDVLVEDCRVSSQATAFKTGTESMGGFRRVKVRGLTVRPSAVRTSFNHSMGYTNGISAVEIATVDGGVSEDVDIDGVDAEGVACAFYVRAGDRGRPLRKGEAGLPPGRLRNVRIANMKATGVGALGSSVTAFAYGRIDGVSIENVSISSCGSTRPGECKAPEDFDPVYHRYPSPAVCGKVPARGLYTHQVRGLSVSNFTFACTGTDPRPDRIDFKNEPTADVWPDGTPVSDWFRDVAPVDPRSLGREFRFDAAGIRPGDGVQTAAIQGLVDKAAWSGGGCVVVTPGTFTTGAIFIPAGVNLRLEEGAVLKGSDFIGDYPLVDTRIEGVTRRQYAALVNVDRADGFTMLGPGVVDGNGARAWRASRLRRRWNPQATNLDEQRVRLLSVSHSKDVRIENVRFRNQQFWAQHFWCCENVKLLGVRVSSPSEPPGFAGACTDGIDLDHVRNALVHGCRIENWDDAVALKGGISEYADDFARYPDNGPVENVLVEDTVFGHTHAALALGSGAVRVRNVVMRRVRCVDSLRVLWLKFRSDTPQLYEHVRVEDVRGSAEWGVFARLYSAHRNDWEGREKRPADELLSQARHVTVRNWRLDCRDFYDINENEAVAVLDDFSFENLAIRGDDPAVDGTGVRNLRTAGVKTEKGSFYAAESHARPDAFGEFFYSVGTGTNAAADRDRAQAVMDEAERRVSTPFAEDCVGGEYLVVFKLPDGARAAVVNLERQYPKGLYEGCLPIPPCLRKRTLDWTWYSPQREEPRLRMQP